MPASGPAAPSSTATAAPAAALEDDDDDDSDDDSDVDLFGELTPEEQEAADKKKALIEAAKKRGAEKAKLTKSMVVLEVKPWDDTTGLRTSQWHSATVLQFFLKANCTSLLSVWHVYGIIIYCLSKLKAHSSYIVQA